MIYKKDIGIIGGAGHIGLPLALAFARKKKKVIIYDINHKNLKKIQKNQIPFREEKASEILKKFKKNIELSSNINSLIECKFIIICIGTPINKNLKPEVKKFLSVFKILKKILNKNQHLIIRSSVYPGTIHKIKKMLNNFENITYCPERIVQGFSLIELPNLTQIISGFSKKSTKEVSILFNKICKNTIICSVKEAEIIKLFSNAYRYITFSIANQFFMMSENLGLDYKLIRKKMIIGYPRNKNIPRAGFAAGPCLLKDTMQLSSYFKYKFNLGKSAMQINEQLPDFILKNLEKKFDLKNKTIGVLGLAFKAETDDIRDSLAIKLVNILRQKKIKFYQSDEYFKDKKNVTINTLIKKSDIIIIGAYHDKYKKISFPKDKVVINVC